MDFLPKVPALEYTVSAVAVGLILIDDLTPAKQNSVGNWFMLIGQTICSNAAQQQVINTFNKTSNSSNQHIVNDNNIDNQIEMMQKAIDAINKEIESIKKPFTI